MLRVFLDAGYSVRREYDSGVVDLVFDIQPTDKSREVMIAREHRAEARSIARLLVAAVDRGHRRLQRTDKLGHAVLVNLLRSDFTGPVYPVNPDTVSVQGVRAYPAVTDIPDAVDLAVVTVPAAKVAEVVESCRIKGVHALVVMTAGFADARPGAARRPAAMVAVGPRSRDAGARAELPGAGEHRPRGADERHPRPGGAAARAGSASSASPGPWASRSSPTPRRAGSGLSTFVSAGTGPTSRATTCCSSGRATTAPRWSCCTWNRSATRANSPGWPGCWPGRNR